MIILIHIQEQLILNFLFLQMSKFVDHHVLKQYEIKREMGSGAYGHVWQVKQKKTGQIFALKKVFDAFRNSIDAQRTYRQVEILHKLKHDNIIKLYRVIKSKNNKDLYLIFSFMEADLHSVVGTNILQKMHQIYIFYQLLKAICYIHSAQLIHRDLKPSNILINSECKAKICDFGLIRSLNCQESEQIVLSEQVATKWYRAPQLLLGSRSYGKPVDIWSFGCIVAELLTGRPMFAGNSTLNQFQKILQYTGQISKQNIKSIDSPVAEQLVSQIKIKRKSFAQYFSHIDPDFYKLIEGSLQFNPKKRLTAEEALNLSIFQEFQKQPLIIMGQPVIPAIDDNVRLPTKAYRDKIYDDIDHRYSSSMPLKDKMNQIRSLSIPKKEKEKEKVITKKRPYSVKKETIKQLSQQWIRNESISKKSSCSSTALGILKKMSNKYTSSPYFKYMNKHSFCESGSKMQKLQKEKYQSLFGKSTKKQQGAKSNKVLKKGIKQRVSQSDKKCILKSIGVDKPKKLQKYMK